MDERAQPSAASASRTAIGPGTDEPEGPEGREPAPEGPLAWIPLGLACGGALAVGRALVRVAALVERGLDPHAAAWSVAQRAPGLFLRAFVTGLVGAALVARARAEASRAPASGGGAGDGRADGGLRAGWAAGFAGALFLAALLGWPPAGTEERATLLVAAAGLDARGLALTVAGALALALALDVVVRARPVRPALRAVTAGPGATLLALGLALGAPAAYAWRQARRPPSMPVEVHVARLWDGARPAATADEVADRPRGAAPESGGHDALRAWIDAGDGAPRPALAGTPPWRARFVVPEPPGAPEGRLFLEARTGLEAHGPTDAGPDARVGFEVRVDGALVERVVAGTRARAGWRRSAPLEHLPLAPGAVVELATTVESGAGGPDADRPGTDGAAGSPAALPRAAFADLRLVGRYRRPRGAAGGATPSVVLVVIDGLRADRLLGGAADAAVPRPGPTPAIDALAERGLAWTAAYAASPRAVCAHASLVTGLPALATGTVDGRPRVPAELETLFELARRGGATTAGFGNGAGSAAGDAPDLAQGIETFEALAGARAEAVVRRALDWHARWRATRSLVLVHLADLAAPRPSAATLARVAGAAPADLPCEDRDALAHYAARVAAGLDPAAIPPAHRAWLATLYDAAVAETDAAVGALTAGLAELGLAEHTVVAVTATRGFQLGEHGHLGVGRDLSEAALRVPLVLAGPGIAGGGGRAPVTTPVEARHLAVTLARLVDAELAAAIDGRWLGAPPPPGEAGLALSALAAPGAAPALVLRTGPWSLHLAPTTDAPGAEAARTPAGGGGAVARLYRVPDDPLERLDRSAREPREALRLLELLELVAARATAARPALVPWPDASSPRTPAPPGPAPR